MNSGNAPDEKVNVISSDFFMLGPDYENFVRRILQENPRLKAIRFEIDTVAQNVKATIDKSENYITYRFIFDIDVENIKAHAGTEQEVIEGILYEVIVKYKPYINVH